MTNFDRTEYRRVVRRLAGDVDARVEDGMSVRAALYRSVGECIVDLWNHDTSLRVCELSEKDPEIEIVNKIITGDETDTHADHELFVRATDDIDIRAVAAAAREAVPEGGVTAIAVRDNRIEFLSGARDAVADAVVDATVDQF